MPRVQWPREYRRAVHSDSEARNDPASRHLPDHFRGDLGVGGQKRVSVSGHTQNRLGFGLLRKTQLRADFGQNGARRVQVRKNGIGDGYL